MSPADTVRIERLVFDIPGLTPSSAAELATHIARALADANPCAYPQLAVALEAREGEASHELAARIIQQLLQQIE
jgi:hypothetical protein